jgi:transcriptional regulator with XRE-family HTH domain
MDRVALADFLRRRREALQPADVGLLQGQRRRTSGLRREEVAVLSGMSTDYYARLEQQRGPQPSEQMVAAIARGLRLTLDERDHLFRLTGHTAPTRRLRSGHVEPALMRVLDRLDDTPAMVLSDLSETLAQNRLAMALLGDQSGYTGPARSAVYRWFTDPAERLIYPEADREAFGRLQVSTLRAVTALPEPGTRSPALALVEQLRSRSTEFDQLWQQHEVGLKAARRKHLNHPELGLIELDCQFLFTENRGQALLIFTAVPGTEDHEKLRLLSVIGSQQLAPDRSTQ